MNRTRLALGSCVLALSVTSAASARGTCTVTDIGPPPAGTTATPTGTSTGCSTLGTPSGATLVAMLNQVQPDGAALITTGRLADAIRVRPLDLNHDGTVDTLAAFVTSGGSTPGTYVFLLDPATGQPQAANPITGAPWQNPLLLLSGVGANQAAAGDVNGDGIPDFAQAGCCSTPYLFVGSVDSTTRNPSWQAYPITPPASQSVAFGDVDGIGHDEIVFGGAGAGKKSPPGAVFIYQYLSTGSVVHVRDIQDPTALQGTGFGNAIAIGNISGTGGNDLVVGAPSAGLVYVFPPPAQQANHFTITGPGPDFGRNLGIADLNLNGTPDLLVITGTQSGSGAEALVYAGPVYHNEPYTNQLLPGQSSGWGTPNIDVADMTINSLPAGAVAVGAPQTSTCGSISGGIGALNLYTSPSSGQPNYVFETPYPLNSSQYQFGYSVGIAPGYPFIVIGEHFRDVGTTSMAGQVYVYRLGN